LAAAGAQIAGDWSAAVHALRAVWRPWPLLGAVAAALVGHLLNLSVWRLVMAELGRGTGGGRTKTERVEAAAPAPARDIASASISGPAPAAEGARSDAERAGTADASRLHAAGAARIFFAGALGKYVPGPVFSPLAQAQIGRAAGIAPSRTLAAFGVHTVVSLTAGGLVGLLALPALLGRGSAVVTALCVAAAPVGALLVPGALLGMCGAVLRRVRPGTRLALSTPAARRAVLLSALSWTVSGTHVWILAAAAGTGAAFTVAASCIGAMALGICAGTAAFFLPDGLGAREAVVVAVLVRFVTVPQAAAVALLSRMILLVTEALLAGAAFAWRTPHAYALSETGGALP
jgi:hypothetical protein